MVIFATDKQLWFMCYFFINTLLTELQVLMIKILRFYGATLGYAALFSCKPYAQPHRIRKWISCTSIS